MVKSFYVIVMLLFSIPAFAHDKVVVIPMGGESEFTTCKEILDAGSSIGDGSYVIKTAADEVMRVYCDMATATTYEEFAFGNHLSTYTGYMLPDIADWQNAAFQQAYIWNHNRNNGLRNIDVGYTSGNCCISLANGLELEFNGVYVTPWKSDGTTACITSYFI